MKSAATSRSWIDNGLADMFFLSDRLDLFTLQNGRIGAETGIIETPQGPLVDSPDIV